MLVGLHPPGERNPAGYSELEIMDRLLVQAKIVDHLLIQMDPVGILAERRIEIRIRNLSALFIDPGGKHGKIISEFKGRAKGFGENTDPGNQQQVFCKGIGLPDETHVKYNKFTILGS
jgi:hypothetical protein